MSPLDVKKKFENPVCEIVVFNVTDIVATSSEGWDAGVMPAIDLPKIE